MKLQAASIRLDYVFEDLPALKNAARSNVTPCHTNWARNSVELVNDWQNQQPHSPAVNIVNNDKDVAEEWQQQNGAGKGASDSLKAFESCKEGQQDYFEFVY